MRADEVGVGPLSAPRLAILDRDGTIVEAMRDATGAVTSAFTPEELRVLPGVVPGLRALQHAGFVLAIATNQPGPAKGQASRDAVARTNAALVTRLGEAGVAIAVVEVCMHHPVGGPGGDRSLVGPCDCRKPSPGMLLALLAQTGADPARSWMIGDSAVDVQAGRAAAIRVAIVGAQRAEITADVVGATLVEVAAEIVRLG